MCVCVCLCLCVCEGEAAIAFMHNVYTVSLARASFSNLNKIQCPRHILGKSIKLRMIPVLISILLQTSLSAEMHPIHFSIILKGHDIFEITKNLHNVLHGRG